MNEGKSKTKDDAKVWSQLTVRGCAILKYGKFWGGVDFSEGGVKCSVFSL